MDAKKLRSDSESIGFQCKNVHSLFYFNLILKLKLIHKLIFRTTKIKDKVVVKSSNFSWVYSKSSDVVIVVIVLTFDVVILLLF